MLVFLAGERASWISDKHGPLSAGRAQRLPEKKKNNIWDFPSQGTYFARCSVWMRSGRENKTWIWYICSLWTKDSWIRCYKPILRDEIATENCVIPKHASARESAAASNSTLHVPRGRRAEFFPCGKVSAASFSVSTHLSANYSAEFQVACVKPCSELTEEK